jgi:phosphodiesterase/alkaline phosphatase D-like protein
VSCSNYPAGFFNIYREIAGRDDLDAVLHLGDYIYEYGMNDYATESAESLGRIPQPLHELRSLADYRERYASNPVVLSGDLHTSLAADLIPEDKDTPVSVELMAGAVSSPVMTHVLPEKRPNALRDAVLEQNPWLSFLDGSHRGWLCVTVTDERCTGEWYLIDTVTSRDYRSWLAKTLFVRAGEIEQGLQA